MYSSDNNEQHLVDPDSGLKETAHIYCGEINGREMKYMVVLGLVDIEQNKNSYFRMQLLESNDSRDKSYWIFESWGRISTSIGSKRLTDFPTAEEARKRFEKIYKEKCDLDFGRYVVKRPGKFFPLDIDFQMDNLKPRAFVPSKLSLPFYELMEMIFDMKHVDKMAMGCDVDLKRMPLGQISPDQIRQAMLVLKEISKHISQNSKPIEIQNASNEFYTLIPHGFSVKRPPLIDSTEVVKEKGELLQSLLNMGVIYGYLNQATGEKINPMDACFKKITTDISILSKDAPEFTKISEIVRDTHGSTHNKYTLEVVEVFKLNRKREDVRSRTYNKLENHQMLWHGSRTTNFVSILTKGLRIAPKEAPATGYMFGKGIYFADIVSKSANYCISDLRNNTGLLLLCDVALGKSRNPSHAVNCSDLPTENEHSVKACGAIYPTEYSTLDGIQIATGGLCKASFPTGLNYNEYVVYDINQVKMKYLVKVKFNAIRQ